MSEPAKNQCMGCQAGWPFAPGDGRTHVTHYPNGGGLDDALEYVACTAERYAIVRAGERLRGK